MARTGTTSAAQKLHEIYKNEAPDLRIVQLHTKVPAKERKVDAGRLKRGEVDVVVCVDMLGEGFDLPELKIAAFHAIRQSLAITLQLAGRFTRSRSDLGSATFIADISDNNVRDELKRLYTQDPDWNALLPQLSEEAIGEQASIKELVASFSTFTPDISLEEVRPATSAVVYKTQCEDWSPDRFRAALPSADACEKVYHTISDERKILVSVTGRRLSLPWTEAENVSSWQWDLYVAYWNQAQSCLFLNSSSNSGDFQALAHALTGEKSKLIKGDRVFRIFDGLSLLRLQNVGLTQFLGRNIRYMGRMGSDVDPSVPESQRANSQKSVIAGVGYARGALVTAGASKRGRIWSHQRERLDQFMKWCDRIGEKLNDETIDSNDVFKHCLIPAHLSDRPNKRPLTIDWPEELYLEPERNWILILDGKEIGLSFCSIELETESETGPLRFAVVAEQTRVEFDLSYSGSGDDATCDFIQRGETQAKIKHGAGAKEQRLDAFFTAKPPAIWFTDGSSLEGNKYIEIRVPPPSFQRADIHSWNWTGVNLKVESQGPSKRSESIQRFLIDRLLEDQSYHVVFDDDNSGEAADVIAIKLDGNLEKPERIWVELFHCKYSGGKKGGARVGDLYEVCGQAQKSIWWAATPTKKVDLFTHMMRREQDRINKKKPSRLERGTAKELSQMREISKVRPVQFSISIVQPGVSQAKVSEDQLRLLGITKEFLRSHFEIPFKVIANT